MKKAVLFAVVFFCLLSGRAVAGWYHVENFTGSVGPYPVHVSLQTYDSFGSGITVEGSYYYDSKDNPIPLYGTNKNGEVALCEISDDKTFDRVIVVGSKTPVDTTGCSFSLGVDDHGAAGTWSNGTKSYPVTLKKVATLDDTGDAKLDGTVEIPFWAQTASHMFVGDYANSSDGLCMRKLAVIDKATKTVDQLIGFDDDDCNAGMVMTPIYMNVEKSGSGTAALISVDVRDGKMGHSKDYRYDAATNRYSLKQ
jgi:hypothetical protein